MTSSIESAPPGALPGLAPPAALAQALRFSRYAARLVESNRDCADEVALADIAGGWDREAMQRFLAASAITDGDSLAASLRRLRQRVMVRLAVRDLAGLAPLEEVHATMSDLADVALGTAHAFWTRALESEIGIPHAHPRGASGRTSGEGSEHGQERGAHQQLLVVGMGKLGGRELNVSSDIDLIFLYPEEGETHGARIQSTQEFFTKLGQRIIATLNDVTSDGQVFRVDMRLRPWGDGGPLVTSFAAFENYLMVHGREWERYAWIKSRVVAGGDEPPAGYGRSPTEELRALVRPFVFRRYLDFGTIANLRELHAQIRQEVARRDLAEHVKLGPGGIREIEFIAQAIQLIRAGRDHALQIVPTLQVLRQCALKGLLAPETVRELADAYRFLRRLEHRLQYLEDQQTHTLPQNEADRRLIAEAMGFADIAGFMQALDAHRAAVTRHFAAVFRSNEAPADDAPATARQSLDAVWLGTAEDADARAALSTCRFADPNEALRRLRALRSSARYRGLPAASQSRLDRLVPRMIAASAQAEGAKDAFSPDAALERMLKLVEAVSGRSAYLALLDERRDALAKIAKLLGTSSWAASYLTRHPILIDELLDPRLYGETPTQAAFAAELRQAIAQTPDDVERQMDAMREIHHAQVFRLLVQDLEGRLAIETLADHLTALADAVLAVTLEICWSRLLTRHRDVPRFAVIGYGKLGGKELGYASDLDLAFIYDDDDPNAPEIYARFAQRVVTWLSSRTGAGILFETDLRLRPNGEAGLLVVSMEAFRKYQRESAWSWEHQALTRARACAGEPTLAQAFEEEREHILTRQRDPAALAAEVAAMREKMFQGHPNRSGLFDVKHGRGGMIDIEFVTQYLVLAHAHQHRRLTGNLGNIALLGIAAELGLLEAAIAAPAREAYREFRRIQHRLRLNDAEFARVSFEDVAPHALAARRLWDTAIGPRPAREY